MGTRTASEGARRRKVSDLAAGLGRSGRQTVKHQNLGLPDGFPEPRELLGRLTDVGLWARSLHFCLPSVSSLCYLTSIGRPCSQQLGS